MENIGQEQRPRTPAAERILRAASEMFYWRGIRAVGVDAIAEEAGVTKKTLYYRFGSKDELVAAYLRARDERWREWVERTVEKKGGTPEERILSTFDALGAWIERENARGCGFVNAAVELSSPDHPARKVVMEQKRWLRDYLTGLTRAIGVEDPEDLAERFLILHEGVSVTHSLGTASDPALKARQVAASLLANI